MNRSTASSRADELIAAFDVPGIAVTPLQSSAVPSPPPAQRNSQISFRNGSNDISTKYCENHPDRMGMVCLRCYHYFCMGCMSSDAKNGTVICITCRSGNSKVLDQTPDFAPPHTRNVETAAGSRVQPDLNEGDANPGRGKKRKQGRIHGQYQSRTGGQGRKCVFSPFSTRVHRRTNGPTDRRTDKASYRVTCPQLKTS